MSECVLIVQPVTSDKKLLEGLQINDNVEETEGLVRAIDLSVSYTHIQKVSKVLPSHLFGKGVRERIFSLVEEYSPDLIVVNASLSPIQQRNLEKDWKCKVIDRTALILEIFGARAQTKEGVIQVELASLSYQRSRLVRSWTHLERQRGGAGFMGGPGETQIELDRRIIADKISKLKKDLKKIRQNRALQRESRDKTPFPTIALVGYTNAGKSTLFNLLTGANVFAEDLPFATLDPTLRAVKLSSGEDVIFSDTVGFISNLPTQLIEAFRATLEEVIYADIILHVRDIASEYTDEQKDDVIDVLREMDIDYSADPRIIEVWNKVDCLDEEGERAFPDHVIPISAVSGFGVETLLERVSEYLSRNKVVEHLKIPASNGKAVSWLHRHGEVLKEEYQDEHVCMDVRMSEKAVGQFKALF
ncbi:MAG: GTPase HflX [Bdellovibrionales bacterium]